jgi:hypothetical protein
MKSFIFTGLFAVTVLLTGCGKQDRSVASNPIAQPALTAWRQGNQAAAVSEFLAADWNIRPLFAATCPLSLSEDQFKALSATERPIRSNELMAQLDSFKQLAAAVIQAGQDAAAKGDPARARKDFTALKQCGAALDGQGAVRLVQLVGQSLKKRADAELSKLGQ